MLTLHDLCKNVIEIDEDDVSQYIAMAEDYLENLDEMYIIQHDPLRDDLKLSKHHDCYKIRMRDYVQSLGGWDEVSVVDEEWTRWRNRDLIKTFYYGMRLKPEYKEIIRLSLEEAIANATIALEARRRERELLTKEHEKEKKNFIGDAIWNVEEKVITDEGGKTSDYIHRIKINDVEYVFRERNVFDFGRVINPSDGGLVNLVEKNYVVMSFSKGGWTPKRTLCGDELRAYLIVLKYGKYSKCHVRM